MYAFSILGSFKCECLSVVDLKDAWHNNKLLGTYKSFWGINLIVV